MNNGLYEFFVVIVRFSGFYLDVEIKNYFLKLIVFVVFILYKENYK